MKKIISISVFFVYALVLHSCIGSKELLNEKQKESLSKEEISATYPISTSTKCFILDLDKELKENKVNVKFFEPSRKLIESYSLIKINQEYCISGFIKVNPTFIKTELEKKGVLFGSTSGQIVTVNVPLSSLQDFLSNQSIQYFEISSKVEIRIKNKIILISI